MRKVKFTHTAGYAGTDTEENFEFDDNITDKEIDEHLEDWVASISEVEYYWEDVEDEI